MECLGIGHTESLGLALQIGVRQIKQKSPRFKVAERTESLCDETTTDYPAWHGKSLRIALSLNALAAVLVAVRRER
jgi:hypothetical protein